MSKEGEFWSYEHVMSLFCIIGAMIMTFVALFIPPQGIIDNSVLILVAEVLVFAASIMGIKTTSLSVIKDIAQLKSEKSVKS